MASRKGAILLVLEPELIVRFWARVEEAAPPEHRPEVGPCLLWTGTRRHKYGALTVHNRPVYAHRLAYLIYHGVLPTKLVRHACDIPLCVRREHLLSGTDADNHRDARERGRAVPPPHYSGLANPKATVLDDVVEAVRMDARPQRVVARELGVSQSTVWRWRQGQVR